jgi:hypothetical protein
MKKHLLLFLLASTFAITATAQLKPTTRQECTRRCNADDEEFTNHPSTPKHKERLRRIQEQRQNETDPEKLKALAKAEEEEMDIRKDEIDQICRWICRHNPEE